MKQQNSLHVKKELILCQSLIVNQLWGPGACSPGKFVNVGLLKSPETRIFLFIFASSKFSRRATKLHETEHFARDFEHWGGHVPPAVGQLVKTPPSPNKKFLGTSLLLAHHVYTFSLQYKTMLGL